MPRLNFKHLPIRNPKTLAWAAGPGAKGRRQGLGTYSPYGYRGRCDTPSWLLSKTDGDKHMQTMREMFKGFDPSPKKVVGTYKTRVPPGKAAAGPPIGPIFSSQGVRAIEFIKAFNDRTAGVFKADPDMKLKVYIRFYEDKSFQYRILPPTTAWLIRQALDIPPGSDGRFQGGVGIGNTDPPQYEAYITLEMLYHVAALVNTWDKYPDWVPLEFRVLSLIQACEVQGVCVLGVHTRPGPVKGFSDADYEAYVKEQKEKWNQERMKEADCNPLLRVPWSTNIYNNNMTGYELPGPEPLTSSSDVVKEAQAVDAAFQGLMKEEDKTEKVEVEWNVWKQTGILQKKRGANSWQRTPEAAKLREHYTQYLARRSPSFLPTTNFYRALWWQDHWDRQMPMDGMHHLPSRIR